MLCEGSPLFSTYKNRSSQRSDTLGAKREKASACAGAAPVDGGVGECEWEEPVISCPKEILHASSPVKNASDTGEMLMFCWSGNLMSFVSLRCLCPVRHGSDRERRWGRIAGSAWSVWWRGFRIASCGVWPRGIGCVRAAWR